LNSGEVVKSLLALQVLDFDLEESDLKEVLMEAMQTMGGGAHDTDISDVDEEAGSKCFGGFGGKRKTAAAEGLLSAEELELAAKWLLDRFGHDEDSEEEASEEEDEEVRASRLRLPATFLCGPNEHACLLSLYQMHIGVATRCKCSCSSTACTTQRCCRVPSIARKL
jgi:hypothetical protein